MLFGLNPMDYLMTQDLTILGSTTLGMRQSRALRSLTLTAVVLLLQYRQFSAAYDPCMGSSNGKH